MLPAAKIQSSARSMVAQVLAFNRQYPWFEAIAIVLASAVLFGVGQELTISVFIKENLSVCWPLIGLQAAILLRSPRKHWPWILSGMVLGQIVVEWFEPVDELITDIVGDLGEVAFAAFALPALNGLSRWMKEPKLLRRFIVWPTLIGPALTGLPVAAAFSRELHVGFWGYWARWFTGDMLGMVLCLPLGIVIMSRETYDLFRWQVLPRTVGLLGALLVTGWAIFHFRPISLAFMLMPLLLLIALKLGFSGSVIAVNILSVLSAEGTLRGLGPFGSIPEPFSVTTLQVFLAFCMLMCFPISIVLLERDTFEREIKDAYARMELLAISDSLTGLANRRRFDTVFEAAWRSAMRERDSIGLLLIDVDFFKLFNDLYGHLAGDECLRQIADALSSKVNRADDLVARYGGEEFVILMPHTDLNGALQVAEAVRSYVESLHREHGRSPHKIITVSIGCSTLVPSPEVNRETLIAAADAGLYTAKQNGRNRVETMQLPSAQDTFLTAS